MADGRPELLLPPPPLDHLPGGRVPDGSEGYRSSLRRHRVGLSRGRALHFQDEGTEYRKLILYPTIISALVFFLMPLVSSPWAFVALVIAAVASGYFRGGGITLLENEQIGEERATALSFLNTLRGAFWAVGPLLWGGIISALGLRSAFFLAGGASLISLFLLMLIPAIRGD